MFNGKAIADGGSVIHDVEAIAFKLQCLRKLLHYVREVVERVFKLMHGRRRALAETGVIGRDQMVAVCQFRHQVPEHLRRSRKAVQQKHRWGLRRTGLAVEDVQSINVDGFVSDHCLTGTSAGAPLSFTMNTTNFAGLVWLAFRPTT